MNALKTFDELVLQVYTRVHTLVHAHVCTHVNTHTCMQVCLYAYTHVYTHVGIPMGLTGTSAGKRTYVSKCTFARICGHISRNKPAESLILLILMI